MKTVNDMLLRCAYCIALVTVSSLVIGQEPAAVTDQPAVDNIQSFVELMRSDLSTAKKTALTEALQLSTDEASTFWPLYREYELELARLTDRRVALITQFARDWRNATFTDSKADALAEQWFALEQDRLELWQSYYSRFKAALSATRAAQFVQAEHQVAVLVDLQIASEIPLMGSQPDDSDAEVEQPAAEGNEQ